jgi:hypothetical protein
MNDNYLVDKELEKLRKTYGDAKILKDILADNRAKMRKIASDAEIDFSAIEQCIRNCDKVLLIECYTFVEQMAKNLVFLYLDKGKNSNEYLERFLEEKVGEKYSPRVKYGEFRNLIKKFSGVNDIYDSFILRGDLSQIRLYDELVKSRHQFAHANNYTFEFVNYIDVLDVLEYLAFEFKVIMNGWGIEFFNYKKNFKKLQNEISNGVKSKGVIKIKECLKEIRKETKKIYKKHYEILAEVSLLENFISDIEKMSNMDLRKMNESIEIVKNAHLDVQ